MNQSLKSFLIVAAVVAAWGGSSALFGLIFEQALPCMSLGVLIAGGLLLAANSDENHWRRLTWQPYDERVSPGLLFGCLVGFPFSIAFGALIAWLSSLAFEWLFS